MDIHGANTFDLLKKCTEILPFTIYVFDFNSNKFIYTNRNFEEIIGYPTEEAEKILANPAPDEFHIEDLEMLAQTYQAIRAGTKRQVDVTYRVRQKNGEYRWLRSRKIVFEENPDGSTKQFLGISEDVTHRKKIENELVEAKQSLEEALTAKEGFFSVISHEIRTSLNAITGMIHLLQQSAVDSNQIEIVDTLKFSSDNLLVLIDDILDFSKIQAGKLEFEEIDFDIQATLEHTRKLYNNKAKDKGISLRLHIHENVPRFVKGDPMRLGQILNNLVSNAIKFTEQGNVTISLYQHRQTKRGHSLVFKVSDTGIGIPSDKLKVIFEPFKQSNKDINRRFGGTGLGLSIIKNLVGLQKGKISVQSKVNEGSTFEVKLKFNKSEKVIEKQPSELNKDDLNLHVLYIEDVVPNQFLMRGYCSHWNVTLDMASSGEEGIQKLKKQQYDLVLMDIQMPGMDGFKTTEKIRALSGKYFKTIPILAVSASTNSANSSIYSKVGMNGYILKPLNPETLYNNLLRFAPKQIRKNAVMQRTTEKNRLAFSQLDEIYQSDKQEYHRLLEVMKQQFENDKAALLKAVREKNNTSVAKIRHRSLATMAMLQQHDFLHFIKELSVLEEKKEDEIKNIANYVDDQYNEIIVLIQHKIKALPLEKGHLHDN